LYVPKACENNSYSAIECRLHVAFHGCEQSPAKIHDIFVREAGYNPWADTSRVIILYPQVKPWKLWADPVAGNPEGCFDWWGYSGDDYLGRNGKQMRAVRDMIGRLLPRRPQP
jgi:poly(3-hydroxybutyrate) depolymerase